MDKFNQLFKTLLEEVSTFLDSENKLEKTNNDENTTSNDTTETTDSE